MPTTSNFGWTTPADTDLVKDGAAAIRTLGNNIDASLVDLKGGTTGQVLAKASNADLDYTWSNVDPLTILDAKGDLITATAADTPARLAVGTNGQYLQADSTTSTGLKWATVSAGGMTELATGSFSSTTTTISSISTSYKNLLVVIRDLGNATGADTLRMRFNGDSTSSYGSRAFTDASAEAAASSSSFNIQFHGDEADSLIYIEIPDYANTSTFKIQRTLNMGGYSSNVLMNHSWGILKKTIAVTELNFFWDSGYTFNAGTYILYGVS